MLLTDYIKPGGENKKMELVMKLHKQMMRWKTGTVIDGELQDEADLSLDDPIWKRFRTQTIYSIHRYKQGSCWDFVNYQHYMFTKWEIEDESYMFIIDIGPPGQVITHTFSIIHLNNTKYWFECSWKEEAGIVPINSFLDVIVKLAHYYDSRSIRNYRVYRYDPEGLDRYLTDEKFYARVSGQELVLEKIRENYDEESTGLYHSVYRSGKSDDTDWFAERFRF